MVRKSLIKFLIMVLLLQFTWIAAATACGHETDARAHHFGHHVHAQKADTSKATDKAHDAGKLGGIDDCPICHLACGHVPMPTHAWVSVASAFAVPNAPPAPRLLVLNEAPERPRWRAAA